MRTETTGVDSVAATSAPPAGARVRRLAGAIALGAAAVAATAALWPRFSQDPAYHRFVDTREILHVDNGLNVLSNVAFALAGAAGLAAMARERGAVRAASERRAWTVLFAGVAATAAGSAAYHLAPSNETLFLDRLPMAVGFAGLVAALAGERLGPAAARRWLGPLVAISCGSVVYWGWSEWVGAGDLRPYAVVQLASVLAIPVFLAARRGPPGATRAWLAAFGLYALAKVAEVLDAPVYAALGVSGHTIKHVLAAAGVATLAAMLHGRRDRRRATHRGASARSGTLRP